MCLVERQKVLIDGNSIRIFFHELWEYALRDIHLTMTTMFLFLLITCAVTHGYLMADPDEFINIRTISALVSKQQTPSFIIFRAATICGCVLMNSPTLQSNAVLSRIPICLSLLLLGFVPLTDENTQTNLWSLQDVVHTFSAIMFFLLLPLSGLQLLCRINTKIKRAAPAIRFYDQICYIQLIFACLFFIVYQFFPTFHIGNFCCTFILESICCLLSLVLLFLFPVAIPDERYQDIIARSIWIPFGDEYHAKQSREWEKRKNDFFKKN